ncbi:MAG: class I SAM-dependent methyltransferase [Candidatus Promineifilaceae bacterium]|nr:class I SAM-dependent methyltransferase [Candidatus Promineifilaceae bacterium]
MSDTDYEFNSLLARAWDFMRGDTSGFADGPFFRLLIENHGQPALDVGCGTGRLLLDYRAAGMDVDGVDVSPEMVAICREKAQQQAIDVAIYTQAMEALDLPRQYQTIIIPSMSFQLLPDLVDAQEALRRFQAHLLPGGTLAMAIWHIKKAGEEEYGDWWLVVEKEGYEGDKTLKRWERSRFDAVSQLRHTENKYELFKDGRRVYMELHQRSPELRSYSLRQLTAMLEDAGYVGVHAVSGLENEPAADDDAVFYIIASKAEHAAH